jgi:hypothetical protein
MFLVFATGVPSRKLRKGTPAAKTIAFGNLPFATVCMARIAVE